MSLSERVRDTLAVLRGSRLSPFDLVLEILELVQSAFGTDDLAVQGVRDEASDQKT
jgi:hypothetical protein